MVVPITTTIPNCPRCGSPAADPPTRQWDFGRYHVSRFECVCGDKFNFYVGGAKGGFTIPRAFASRKSFCASCRTQNPIDAAYCKNCGQRIQSTPNGKG